MTTLVFATRNKGKLVELRELLPELTIVALDDAMPEVIEDAPTFSGNAAKKALEVSAWMKLPALADDSGLEVDALGGAPGVYSARYAGAGHDDAANNAKLMAMMAGHANRAARFRASLALADAGAIVATADGVCEGLILDAPRGTGGFGYDPLFYSPELGMTFAEAGTGSKSHLSHRARAMHAIRPALLAHLGNR